MKTNIIPTAQAQIKPIQCQGVVNLSYGILSRPKIIVAIPMPLPKTIDGTNRLSDLFLAA